MPRTPAANQVVRQEREVQIRRAAATLFAQNGYVGTRVDDIADATGISKGLIYHYFGGKAALFTILVARAAEGTIRLYQAAERQSGDVSARLGWLVEQVVLGLQEQSDLFMVVMQALISEAVPEEAHAAALRLAGESQAAMARIIREGQATHVLVDGDPDELALLFSACIQGLAVSQAMTGDVPVIRDTLLGLFARGS